MYEIGSNNGIGRLLRQNPLPLINNRHSLAFFLNGNNNSLRFTSLNMPPVILDGHQLPYSLISNHDRTHFKDPQWKNLFGMNYFSQGILPIKSGETSTSLILNITQMKKGFLIPHILRYDLDKIRAILNDLQSNSDEHLLKSILDEQLDGGRNLLHACIHITTPLTNKEYFPSEEPTSTEPNNKRLPYPMDLLQSQTNNDHNYEEMPIEQTTSHTWSLAGDSTNSNDNQSSSIVIHTNPGSVSPSYIPSTRSSKIPYHRYASVPQETTNTASSQSTPSLLHSTANSFTVWFPCKFDENEKRVRAMKILRLILESPLFQPHLLSLMTFRNLDGQTPFMSAVNSRAYSSALILFEYAMKISQHSSSDNLLPRMIFPSTAIYSDASPLFLLCTNDTCSFTWTGEEHISQAIFECRTCGLSGTLCCCSECAQTCHKGHDCRLKKTSPTAYCDCWEICPCKSLIAGDQAKRLELFRLLLNQTNLVEMKIPRYENLLLYLVQTVARQIVEQQQFARASLTATMQQQARKTREQLATAVGAKKPSNTTESESTIPDHHLEPPQFCRRALELALADWCAVKSMLLCGAPDDLDPNVINTTLSASEMSTSPPSITKFNNDIIFSMDEQQQTSQLDRFTYFLLAKCNTPKQTNDLLEILLNTLIHEMSHPTNGPFTRYVVARFVRSVIRLFVIVHLQTTSDKSSSLTTKSSTSTICQSILSQCRRVFQTFTIISIDALVHVADLLLAPVRHGISKPTALFNSPSSHNDILQSLDEVFNIDSEYSQIYHRSSTDLVDGDVEENDNHSDIHDQPEIDRPSTTTTTTANIRERLTTNLSEDESEMELELLAESDSDNESTHSASNINTHQTSAAATAAAAAAAAGNENIALFTDDDNSDSDDADSIHSEDVEGEGDEASQTEPPLFTSTRDPLAADAVSTAPTISAPTADRSTSASLTTASNTPSAANNQSTETRLPTRAGLSGLFDRNLL